MGKDIFSMFSLDGKVALISGASRGIGLEIASTYAKAGARVVVCSRKQKKIDEAATRIEEESNGSILALQANVSMDEERRKLVRKAMKWAGQIDILVNNAGTNPAFGALENLTESAWDKIFEVNLKAPFFLSQLVYHAWMKEHGGVILNVSSTGGLLTLMGINAYNVTKAGMLHLTRCLASEWGRNGIRVNALTPGIIKTRLSEALWKNPAGAKIAGNYPLSRFGEVSEIAGAALFLGSDAASYITGHSLVVDGGQLVAYSDFNLV
jgi:dehydrogenase/reductase SDR family protein 4